MVIVLIIVRRFLLLLLLLALLLLLLKRELREISIVFQNERGVRGKELYVVMMFRRHEHHERGVAMFVFYFLGTTKVKEGGVDEVEKMFRHYN